jgi:hypothetical protein
MGAMIDSIEPSNAFHALKAIHSRVSFGSAIGLVMAVYRRVKREPELTEEERAERRRCEHERRRIRSTDAYPDWRNSYWLGR